MSEDDYIDVLLEHGVSGIVFVSGMHADIKAPTDRYHRLIDRGIAAVFVNGWVDGIDAAFVSCDDAAAAKLAVGHLHDLGHRRIGLALGPERYTPIIRRRAGFIAALRERDIPFEEELIAESVFNVEGGHVTGEALINAGATAVVCASDLMALGVVRAARARGLDVPRDISVVGYDDSMLIAFVDPPLSTVRQPVTQMGIAAVHALFDKIRDVAVPHTELLFRPELVVRASTGPAPGT
jgi:DNA-binding LacI/PurR family transcriptional regulator